MLSTIFRLRFSHLNKNFQNPLKICYTKNIINNIERIKKDYNSDFYVISTGGVGTIFSELTNKINLNDKYHTIKGLSILYHLHHKKDFSF